LGCLDESEVVVLGGSMSANIKGYGGMTDNELATILATGEVK
jgi:hypothetical protein